MRTSISLFAILIVLLAACASKETLIRKSAVAPVESALSGRWTMLEDMSNSKRDLNRAIGATNSVDDARALRRMNAAQSSGRRQYKSKIGGLVHVFLKNGRTLKITQTDTGLFISFDRSVVEEYRFGEARIVNVGAVDAQRVSGWEGEQYVIETLDKDGMKLTERYRLLDNGMSLRRQIVFRSKKGEEVVNFQSYERDPGN